MMHTLFQMIDNPKRPRVARQRPSTPKRFSRRDFLTFGRTARRPRGVWSVTIDAARCTDCGACVRICEESALRRLDDDAHVRYALDAPSCTGCADCATVCAANALSVQPGNEHERDDRLTDIVTLPKEHCLRCGQSVAGVINNVCSVCRSTDPFHALRRQPA